VKHSDETGIGISQIWKEAFNEDDEYIDFFITEGLPLGHLITCGPVDHPYATLTLFPISFEQAGISYPGFYLYALGTLLSERRKGYGKELVKKAEAYAIETGRHFILLQPTTPLQLCPSIQTSSSPPFPLQASLSLSHLSFLPCTSPHNDLFTYYGKLRYSQLVLRSCLDYSRDTLLSLLTSTSAIDQLVQLSSPIPAGGGLSRPTNVSKGNSFDYFTWAPPLRNYIHKECLLRGGSVIDHAYCYPNVDAEGPFLDIKEFRSTSAQLPFLIHQILNAYPNINRFRFRGKWQSKNLNEFLEEGSILRVEAFALTRFIHSELEDNYNPFCSYFALGLD